MLDEDELSAAYALLLGLIEYDMVTVLPLYSAEVVIVK
jgi:hypothetical protein